MRRAYFDLIGLPPSPEEVEAFACPIKSSGAYERLLDRLLASPHFGERWGRHWLDVVGYTDTVGFDIDATSSVDEGQVALSRLRCGSLTRTSLTIAS